MAKEGIQSFRPTYWLDFWKKVQIDRIKIRHFSEYNKAGLMPHFEHTPCFIVKEE